MNGLKNGQPWDVTFLAFSLDQVHVEEGEPAVWDRPLGQQGRGVPALLWSIVVRDRFPDQFLDFHSGTFGIRHERGLKLEDVEHLAGVARECGLDPEAIEAEIQAGWPAQVLGKEHTEAVDRWAVFGVPTFIVDEEAVFLRMMKPGVVEDVEQALALLPMTRINEFKRTRIPH